MVIRFATNSDVPAILELLRQVGGLHHEGRPDIFRAGAQKYSASEVIALLADPIKPIFIAAEGEICERLMQIPDYVTVQDRVPYERIFKELCAHSETALYQDILFIQSRILELIHLLCAHARYQQAPKAKSSNKNMIEDAVHFIKTNPTADLSLEAMAARYAFSPIHFHTCFKKATGKTLRDFAEEQRIGKAIHLLAATDLTLSEIAYECGFSSQAYFSYAFKKKMKAPPREYAKRLLMQYEK